MTKINKEEVKKVAQLARLELDENEINNHAEQLEKILEYIKQLEKISVTDELTKLLDQERNKRKAS